MKKFLLPLVILLLTITLNAQWVEQTSPVTSYLGTASVVNPMVAWVGGDGGVVLLTTDGGTTWTAKPGIATTVDVQAIYGINATTAIALANGTTAQAWKTSDGGATWAMVLEQAGGFFDGVAFFDATTGILMGDPVGGRWAIFKTTNAGTTWDSTGIFVAQNGTEAGWTNGIGVSGNSAWFGTSASRVYHSTDRGATWTAQTCPVGDTFSFWFTSETTGMAGGRNGTAPLAKTTDGGATWTAITTTLGGTSILYGIAGKGNMWYYSRSTRVFQSTDFGATWDTMYVSPAGSITYLTQARSGDDFAIVVKNNGGIAKGTSLGLPVELTSFTAAAVNNGVQLTWETATEINNQGFEVQRSVNGKDFNTVGFVKGNGTTTEAQKYSYFDAVTSGKYTYRLKQMDFNGTSEYTKTVEVNALTVASYELIQNYPNPFNPSTTISYAVKDAGLVTLKVYNVLGDEVATLVNEVQAAGMHDVRFNASSLSSGVYFYTINAGNFTATKKMILTK